LTTGAGALNRLYHNNGDGTFTKITSGPMLSRPVGADSNGCVWGDYDNDGFLDLFVSSTHGRNQLFRNNGNGTFTEILSGSPVNDGTVNTYYFGVSWVDYDNDGSLDLFVAGGSTDQSPGKNLLYHNGGNSNAWLEVKCIGTLSNRSAIGVKVRVRARISGKTFWQLREITGGGGYNNPSLVAHFGLGDATNVDLLRIEWSSGIAQEFPGVAARQILSVTEPPRLQATAAGQVQFRGWKGQAFMVEGSANLTAWSVLATITNLTGILQFTDPEALSEWQHFYRVRPK